MNTEQAKWLGGIAGVLIAGGFVDVYHLPIHTAFEFVIGAALVGVLIGGSLPYD